MKKFFKIEYGKEYPEVRNVNLFWGWVTLLLVIYVALAGVYLLFTSPLGALIIAPFSILYWWFAGINFKSAYIYEEWVSQREEIEQLYKLVEKERKKNGNRN